MYNQDSNNALLAVQQEMVMVNQGLTKEEVVQHYDEWAPTFDQHSQAIPRNSVRYAAEELARWLPPSQDVRVLDIAAGTGQVASELVRLGYHNIDAIDPSRKMLDIAKSKNVYKNIVVDFFESFNELMESDTYDAAVVAGGFRKGHLKCSCFDEVIRIVKPGGYFVFAMAEQNLRTVEEYKDRLVPRLQQLHDSGHWKWVSRKILPNYVFDQDGFICAFQIMQKES